MEKCKPLPRAPFPPPPPTICFKSNNTRLTVFEIGKIKMLFLKPRWEGGIHRNNFHSNIKKAGFSVNTEFYKITIDSC